MISGYGVIPIKLVDKAKKQNYHQDQHRTNDFRNEAGRLI